VLYKIEFPGGGVRYYCSEKCFGTEALEHQALAVPVLVKDIPADQYCYGRSCEPDDDRPVLGYSEYYRWRYGPNGRKLT
jgi:hypothetical protein